MGSRITALTTTSWIAIVYPNGQSPKSVRNRRAQSQSIGDKKIVQNVEYRKGHKSVSEAFDPIVMS